MEHSSFTLLLGIVLGCVVASGVWAILWVLTKGDNRFQKDRLAIMQELAALCAEIDAVVSVSSTKLQTSSSPLASLLEKLHGKLTVSMPLLDVYFVKYIESLIAQYEQAPLKTFRVEKTVQEPLRKEPPAKEVKPLHISIEDTGPIAMPSSYFDVTQQIDMSKEKPAAVATAHKEVDFEIHAKPAPAVKQPSPAETVAITIEKPKVEIPPAKPEAKIPLDKTKILYKKPATTEHDEVHLEDLIKTQKFDFKEDTSAITPPQSPDQHFINGEDVMDKLDSFFGFEKK